MIVVVVVSMMKMIYIKCVKSESARKTLWSKKLQNAIVKRVRTRV